jgi:hypothetical protein
VEDNQDIQSIERDVAIAATFDVEDQRYVTEALGRSRGQRRGRRHEAGTHDAATAILEIVTGKVPWDVRHRSLPLG